MFKENKFNISIQQNNEINNIKELPQTYLEV